jgi:putative transposase
MDDLPRRRYLKHDVPSWVFDGNVHPAFFITVCCKKRGVNQLASSAVWKIMLDAILNRQERGIWICTLFVAMPDHVHAVLRFQEETRMSPAIRDWKRWIARTAGIEWQRGFFDHRLRSQESAAQKRQYILNNPVRTGLVEKPEDWEFIWDMSAAK